MAIINPEVVVAESGQDLSVTVTMDPATNVTGWTTTAVVRAYNGGSAVATGSVVITTAATGVFTITFTAASLTLAPGAYVWEFLRTNSGFVYPIVEPSAFIVRPSGGGAYPTLTNLSEVQAALQLGAISDAEVPFCLQWIAAAEASVQRICGRKFYRQAGIVEYLDGTGTQTVLLKETPVSSITSVYLDSGGYYGQGTGAFASDTLLTAGEDYYLVIDDPSGVSVSGRLNRIGRAWPLSLNYIGRILLTPKPVPCPGCLKVTYTGGYSLIPADLKLALFQIIADRRGAALNGVGLSGESFEGYSWSGVSGDQEVMKIGSIMRVLNSYKRVPVLVGI